MVLDAELDGPPPRLALRRHDQEGGGLAPAHVAAGRLARLERREQAARERSRRRASKARPIAGQTSSEAIMLAWALKPSPWHVARERDAALAGVRRRPPRGVDTATWRSRAPSSAATSAASAAARGLSGREAVEQVRPVGRLGHRLRRNGADARRAPR